MFCPQCGASQNEDLRFCTKCGANLSIVRQTLTAPRDNKSYNWRIIRLNKIFSLYKGFFNKQKVGLESKLSVSPEVNRYNEIRLGVITSCVSVGVMIFLYVFMQGFVLRKDADPNEIEFFRHFWIIGAIPLMGGIGRIINGLFISGKSSEAAQQNLLRRQAPQPAEMFKELDENTEVLGLNSADANQSLYDRCNNVEDKTERLVITNKDKAAKVGGSRRDD